MFTFCRHYYLQPINIWIWHVNPRDKHHKRSLKNYQKSVETRKFGYIKLTYSAYWSTLSWAVNYLLLRLVFVDHISDCTVLTLVWLVKRELTLIFAKLSFWGTKFLSKRNFVQSIKSVSLTGFNEAYSSSKLVLLKPIERLANFKVRKLLFLFSYIYSNSPIFCNLCSRKLKLCRSIANLQGYNLLEIEFLNSVYN